MTAECTEREHNLIFFALLLFCFQANPDVYPQREVTLHLGIRSHTVAQLLHDTVTKVKVCLVTIGTHFEHL